MFSSVHRGLFGTAVSILAAASLTALFYGCEIKPRSIGQNNELGILIDQDLKKTVEADLLGTFCPVLRTPQPERRFIPIFGGYEDIEKLQTQKYLLVVGTLDGEGAVSRLVQQMLSPEVADGVKRGEYYVFSKRDEWARGQLLMILTAPDAARLVERIREKRQALFHIFDDDRSEQVKEELYRAYEQKDLAADIQERYGFTLRIPHDYVLVREEPEENWLRLKRAAPDRWITLWKSPPMEQDPVDSTWLTETWLQLALKYADPVQANLDYLSYREITKDGLRGGEIRGLWETIGPQGGGPFFCRAVYNPDDRRVYLFDGAVFNPGDVKEPYIKQLEVIWGTFKVGKEKQY